MTRTLRIFNTLTREIEELAPRRPGEIGIYCCGPTVYNFQHIGNFRTFLFEDLLVRTLRYAGYRVKHVMNITDVGHLVSDSDEGEDKMAVAMRREKKRSHEIAEFYTTKFFEDWDKLRLVRPDVVCKATDHIGEMITLIERIEKNSFTYQASGNVYFDVGRLPDYGKLAKLDLENLKAGARVEVDKSKRSPLDFALWFTKSKFENQELQWESPWGRGYPGWHIECSAMSMKYLGEEFDIHCGGIDHVTVHHTNEIAQSEAATGRPWVRYWMHGEFMLFNKEKMAKSTGGFIVLDDVTARGIDPLAYRLLCLGGHYRQQVNFTWEALESTANALRRLQSNVASLREQGGEAPASPSPRAAEMTRAFEEALFNDLNAPRALAQLWDTVSDKDLAPAEKLALLRTFDQVLGLGVDGWRSADAEAPAEVAALASDRERARKEKNWKLADELRAKISATGWTVEDSPQGPKLKRS